MLICILKCIMICEMACIINFIMSWMIFQDGIPIRYSREAITSNTIFYFETINTDPCTFAWNVQPICHNLGWAKTKSPRVVSLPECESHLTTRTHAHTHTHTHSHTHTMQLNEVELYKLTHTKMYTTWHNLTQLEKLYITRHKWIQVDTTGQ